jgi:hypothetical protein
MGRPSRRFELKKGRPSDLFGKNLLAASRRDCVDASRSWIAHDQASQITPGMISTASPEHGLSRFDPSF